MILSRPDILESIARGKLEIQPPIPEKSIKQVSVDLRLGRKFIVFKEPPHYLPAIYVDPSLWESADLWQDYEQDQFRLNPGQFVLAETDDGAPQSLPDRSDLPLESDPEDRLRVGVGHE